MDYFEFRNLCNRQIIDFIEEKRHTDAQIILDFFVTCSARFDEYTTTDFNKLNQRIIKSLIRELSKFD